MPSSILSVVAPSLPQYPGPESKFIKPFNYLFRSPGRPDRVNASKVSASTFSHSTDVYRSRFGMATSTAGSVDPTETFGVVSGWLRDAGTSVVSGFALSRLIDADAVNLDVYRCSLDPSASTPWSNDHVGPFGVDYRWLCDASTYLVSRFDFLRLIDLYSFDLDPAALTPGSIDPIGMSRTVYRWLRDLGRS